jgi:branched-chain amino acid transport system permease protein
VLSPLGVGVLGAFIERYGLRQLGHRAELLITFGVSVIVLELVQLVWGRSSVDYRVPVALEGNLFTLHGFQFPLYRGFMMGVSLSMLAGMWWVMARTRVGWVIQAALSHTHMAEALGHNVPQVLTFVFGGGCALAGLAGVMAGNAFVTEPGMAASMGGMIFVVMVVGGMGSLGGAFVASLLTGVMQTLVAAMDMSLLSALPWLHFDKHCDALCHIQFSQLAPLLPYLLMVLVLIFRPHGMGGNRG